MKKINFDNFRNWMGKATSRKGMGMELALLVLFVVFACSILLVSSAMLGKSNLNDRQDNMARRFELDMFAEAVLKAGDTYDAEADAYDYEYAWSADKKILTIGKDGNTLLTITVVNNKVTSWVYHE